MKGKTGKLLCIYACAAIAVLGLYAGLSRSRLSDFRLAARYSSSRAFEETVGAVGNLSLALRKSLYATDSGMCCRICSDVYADARAAETAMATLPFSTVEMARISGFLGVAGDYAYSLCPEAAANGFSDEQRSALYDMSAAAEEFAMALSEMQGSITDGTITMDTREVRIENVGEAAQQTKLSEQLSEYEESFAAPAALKYDGRYGARDGEETAQKTPEELKKTAADFLGVGEASLDLKYEYSGEDSRRCYSCRGVEVCVDSRGVVSMGSDRIIGDAVLDAAEAEKAAGEFLEQHGYDGATAALMVDPDIRVFVVYQMSAGLGVNNYLEAQGYDFGEFGIFGTSEDDTTAEMLEKAANNQSSFRGTIAAGGGVPDTTVEVMLEALIGDGVPLGTLKIDPMKAWTSTDYTCDFTIGY